MSDDELRPLWKQYRLEAALLRAAGQLGSQYVGDDYRESWAADQLTREHAQGWTRLWGNVFNRLQALAGRKR